MTPEVEAQQLLADYASEIEGHSLWGLKPSFFPSGLAILQADNQLQIAVIRAALCDE